MILYFCINDDDIDDDHSYTNYSLVLGGPIWWPDFLGKYVIPAQMTPSRYKVSRELSIF